MKRRIAIIKGKGVITVFFLNADKVVSDFPEMQRVVAETGCGIAVSPTDQGAVQQAIAGLLGDPGRLRLCREAALAAARQYNWEAEAPRLLEAYQTL